MKNYHKLLAVFSLVISYSVAVEAALPEKIENGIKKSQSQWEEAKYQINDKDQKVAKLEECANDAALLATEFPQYAEPIIWQGICTASQAELLKMAALGKAKAAKALFEKAAKINDKALEGSSYSNLAVLYHRVPGWPIGFGDKKLAEENFGKALQISPKNIDANYFYALFLADQKKYDAALKYLDLAAKAPSRNRPLADAKRKEEVKNKIAEITKKL